MKHTSNTLVVTLERTKPESAPPAPPNVVETRTCLTVSVGETNTDSPVERTAMVPPKSSCATGVDTLSVAPAFCRNENMENPKEQVERQSNQPHTRQLIPPWTKGNVRGIFRKESHDIDSQAAAACNRTVQKLDENAEEKENVERTKPNQPVHSRRLSARKTTHRRQPDGGQSFVSTLHPSPLSTSQQFRMHLFLKRPSSLPITSAGSRAKASPTEMRTTHAKHTTQAQPGTRCDREKVIRRR